MRLKLVTGRPVIAHKIKGFNNQWDLKNYQLSRQTPFNQSYDQF